MFSRACEYGIRASIFIAAKSLNSERVRLRDVASEIKLKDIVVAIDGKQIFTGCGLGLKACNSKKPCPIHNDFANIRNALDKMLEETLLVDLATQVHDGAAYLKFMEI